MVGDVKQSIYQFRLARPQLFLEKYDSYSREEGKYQKIELHQNFRSREQVLTSINEVFYQIMTKKIWEIYSIQRMQHSIREQNFLRKRDVLERKRSFL